MTNSNSTKQESIPVPQDDEKDKNDEKKDKIIKINYFWTIVALVYVVLFALEAVILSQHEVLVLDTKVNLGLSVFLAQILYTFASLQTVGPTELGARLFFGKPIDTVSSGLVFIPLGFFRLSKETRLTVQDELPADPEKIFRDEDVKIPPEGTFPPIRIPFGYPKEKSDDPLNVRVTTEVVPIVRWKIVDYIKFLTTIGDRTEARRQMNDIAIAMLTSEFAKITPAKALEDLAEYNQKLKKEIGSRVETWGIRMENAQIKAINFSKPLNKAIQLVPIATANARATIINAEAERKKRKLEGQGAGEAEQAILKSRSTGLKDMADKLEINSNVVLGAETARAVTANPGQKTVIAGSSGFSDLVATAAAVGEVFSTAKDEKDTKNNREEKS